MGDDPLILESKKPPDFSKWDPVRTLSIFVAAGEKHEMSYEIPQETDERMPLYVGHIEEFEKDKIGLGWNYCYFGQEPRFKVWGMRGEKPVFAWFSVLRQDGKWEVFSNSNYKITFKPEFGKGADAKKVIALKMIFYRKDKNTLLSDLTFTVKR